jgi:DNA-nicking Smr family endonuclease
MSDGKQVPKLTARLRFRSLTPDEEELWSVVVRTVRPLRPGSFGPGASGSVPGQTSLQGSEEPNMVLPGTPQMNGAPKATATNPGQLNPRPPNPSSQPAPTPPALNPIMRKERQKLVRGHAAIDARIDLHGMTQTEAHAALRNLLQRCQANGAKFVLVITGKGQPNGSLNGRGVLRRQVPQWLALPEFRRYVAGFDVAHTGHGGEGALYVRLRKAKVLD